MSYDVMLLNTFLTVMAAMLSLLAIHPTEQTFLVKSNAEKPKLISLVQA